MEVLVPVVDLIQVPDDLTTEIQVTALVLLVLYQKIWKFFLIYLELFL